jgi:inner membrane protein involved in colicin E2 resistance
MKTLGGGPLVRQIAALVFIFVCTTIAWMILGTTLSSRTDATNEQREGRVASTWGTPQEQAPPTAEYTRTELRKVPRRENGKTVVRTERIENQIPVRLNGSRIQIDFDLEPRQKGLLWYRTYLVQFAGDYSFRNDSAEPQTLRLRFKFPAQKAVYDGLMMRVNGNQVFPATDDQGAAAQAIVGPGETCVFHIAYRSQGLNRWTYKLGEGVAQAHDFALSMRTNFKDIDFAEDTLSPTSKQRNASGWDLGWHYSDLISGFEIGVTMPEKLQPGPLAGEISYAAPVSLFFFFFLMFIITTLRNIELHPMNYFFLATAFFAFHLLLAYLVDHISIHSAMVVASVVSVALVVSYLRLVVGIRFAVFEAATAQLVYLVVFSYAFFWKGFTGLAITIISVITLFVVMQATGRIRWADQFSGREALKSPARRP